MIVAAKAHNLPSGTPRNSIYRIFVYKQDCHITRVHVVRVFKVMSNAHGVKMTRISNNLTIMQQQYCEINALIV